MSASPLELSPIAACLEIAHRRGVELARLLLAGSAAAERAAQSRPVEPQPVKTRAKRRRGVTHGP